MRRAICAAIVMMLAVDTADACHHYSRWFYPRRQSCRVTALAPRSAMRLPRVRIKIGLTARLPLPHRVATPVPEILLPDLANIEWGKLPDDEALGRLMLRVILTGKEDK